MPPKEVKQEVRELLLELSEATDVDDKKRIRRSLRRRGHAGGLSTARLPKRKGTK